MKNIRIYRTAADLMQEELPANYFRPVSPDLLEAISSLDDYEDFTYYLIDDTQVIVTDRASGTVLSDESINSFVSNTISEARALLD